jgi:hypothetical protein
MSNILKSEPLFNYFPCNFKRLSLSLHLILTAKLQQIIKPYKNKLVLFIPLTMADVVVLESYT